MLDTIAKLQHQNKDQYEQMNSRIITLENTIGQLVEFIKSSNLQNFNTNNYYSTGETNSVKFHSENVEDRETKRTSSWADVLRELKVVYY